jgi:hypothetical protein
MKRAANSRFPNIQGEENISGKCGDKFTLSSGETLEIVGYTNNGCNCLVKSSSGIISIYTPVRKIMEEENNEQEREDIKEAS